MEDLIRELIAANLDEDDLKPYLRRKIMDYIDFEDLADTLCDTFSATIQDIAMEVAAEKLGLAE